MSRITHMVGNHDRRNAGYAQSGQPNVLPLRNAADIRKMIAKAPTRPIPSKAEASGLSPMKSIRSSRGKLIRKAMPITICAMLAYMKALPPNWNSASAYSRSCFHLAQAISTSSNPPTATAEIMKCR